MVSHEEILNAIESHHWDYPQRLIPKTVESLHTDGLIAIKNNQITKNVLANKIPRFLVKDESDFKEKWNTIQSFYGKGSFSMWIREPVTEELTHLLNKQECEKEDQYEGLLFNIKEKSLASGNKHRIIRVENDLQIKELVEIISSIWGYSKDEKPAIFDQRKDFIRTWADDGGFILAYNEEGSPIGYGNYRYSTNRKVLYLNGSGVRPSSRKQGVYTSLVAHRIDMARKQGCELATCQARVGHSSPILKRLGFKLFSTYQYWVNK